MFNLAVVVRTVGAVWQHLPPDLEAAAATLGASPWRAFREITLPLLWPAILAASAIVFVFTFTSFGVIRVLGDAGTSTIEVEIWRRATQLGDIGTAATLAVAQLVLIGAVVGWSLVAAASPQPGARPAAVGRSPAPTPRPPALARRRRRRSARRSWSGAPLVALVVRSLRGSTGWSLTAWQHARRCRGRAPASASASIRSAPIVDVAAHGRAGDRPRRRDRRARRPRHRRARRDSGGSLDAGLMLPIATSAVTIGFGILITFDQPPVDWRASPLLVPIGQALVAVPFVVRIVLPVARVASIRTFTRRRRRSAPRPSRAWREVTLPHLRRPLVLAAGLAAAISLGEFGATSFLSRRGDETMPIVIERLLGRTGAVLQAQAYALATILAVATVLVVVVLDLAGERPRSADVPDDDGGQCSTSVT